MLERCKELLAVSSEFPGGVRACHRGTGCLPIRGAWAWSPWRPRGCSRPRLGTGRRADSTPYAAPPAAASGRCSRPGREPTCAVFAVLCGAEPTGPAQHPQVEGAPGMLEGRGRRLALDSAAEGTSPARLASAFYFIEASFPPNHGHVEMSLCQPPSCSFAFPPLVAVHFQMSWFSVRV